MRKGFGRFCLIFILFYIMESFYKKYNEKKFYEKDAKQIRLNFLQSNRNRITRITKKKIK